MHFNWHIAVPCVIVGAIHASHTIVGTNTSLFLADSNVLTPINIMSATFIFGSIAPDIGNLGYKIGAWILGEEISLLRSEHWNAKQTNIFKTLDKISWWSVPYKFTHSIFGLFWLLVWMPVFVSTELILAFTAGYLLHLAMDYPTHEICWLAWPFKIIYPAKVQLFRFLYIGNWWEHQKKKLAKEEK